MGGGASEAVLKGEYGTQVMTNTVQSSDGARSLNLRAGEWVEIKSAADILATLDASQSLDGLPFMPEMLQYCGKRFRVYKSAHKTCDTIERYLIRRMNNAVHLEGLRCDGAAHGGCQAGCLIFWKDAWLTRVPDGRESADMPSAAADTASLFAATTHPPVADAPVRYRCQATDLLKATTEVTRRDRFDPRFYVKDLTSGNVPLGDFIKFGILAIVNSFLLRWREWRYPDLRGAAGAKTPSCNMNLQPGEMVQVRSKKEIMQTVNSGLRNRGLGFDVEMVPYCEKGTFKVLRRIEQIINEKTGEMMRMPNPCIVLDNVVCSGNYSHNRMFCPRAVYPYWREIWLRRINEPETLEASSPQEAPQS